jgi:hypothetical protein
MAADRARFADPPDLGYDNLPVAAQSRTQSGHLKSGREPGCGDRKSSKSSAGADERKITEARRAHAAQKALTQEAEGYDTIGKVYPNKSTGRRTALAKLDCLADNP